MILFGMLFPLSIYLLVLGVLNRRRTPVLIPGVWDGIGLLCGVSGFLLVGGPLILLRFNDRIRLNWLISSGTPTLNPGQVEVILAVLYVVGVVSVVVYLFARQRQLTSLYNVQPEQIEQTLDDIFVHLNLQPLRSGQAYFFRSTGPTSEPGSAPVLELEPFEAFNHLTLRWDPANPEVRGPVEQELSRRLADLPTEPNEISFWLILSGIFLFGLSFMGLGVGLILFFR